MHFGAKKAPKMSPKSIKKRSRTGPGTMSAKVTIFDTILTLLEGPNLESVWQAQCSRKVGTFWKRPFFGPKYQQKAPFLEPKCHQQWSKTWHKNSMDFGVGFCGLLAQFCLHFGSQKWPAAGVIFTPNWPLGSLGCLFGSFGCNLGAGMVKKWYFHAF